MKIIVGLGNPGLRYEVTRHNAGFWVVSELAIALGAHFSNKKSLFCDMSKSLIAAEEVILVKPTTFMNDSGRAVQAVLNWFKLKPQQMLVVHDDVSLPLGRIRFQKDGGAGGQHGVESIIECLGGQSGFDRLKFGVGPDPGGDKRAEYVLSSIPSAEQPLAKRCLEMAIEAAIAWIDSGSGPVMNKYNGMVLNGADDDDVAAVKKNQAPGEITGSTES